MSGDANVESRRGDAQRHLLGEQARDHQRGHLLGTYLLPASEQLGVHRRPRTASAQMHVTQIPQRILDLAAVEGRAVPGHRGKHVHAPRGPPGDPELGHPGAQGVQVERAKERRERRRASRRRDVGMFPARLEYLSRGRQRPGQLGDLNVREAVRLRGSDDFVQLGILSARHQAQVPDDVDRALAPRDRQLRPSPPGS